MPSGAAIQSRVARALRTVRASAYPVSLRRTVTTGGNTLLGIGVQRATVDTEMDPPPAVRQVTAEEVATSGGLYQAGDYRFICAGSISREALRNSHLLYGDQVLRIVRMDESVIDGTVVSWTVTARTMDSGE